MTGQSEVCSFCGQDDREVVRILECCHRTCEVCSKDLIKIEKEDVVICKLCVESNQAEDIEIEDKNVKNSVREEKDEDEGLAENSRERENLVTTNKSLKENRNENQKENQNDNQEGNVLPIDNNDREKATRRKRISSESGSSSSSSEEEEVNDDERNLCSELIEEMKLSDSQVLGLSSLPDDEGLIIVTDSDIILLDPSGAEVRRFPYLMNHLFTGGLCLSKSGNRILLGLSSSKYTGVSFYEKSGKFRYSAFIPHPGRVTAVETFDDGFMILDNEKKIIYHLNSEKRIIQEFTVTVRHLPDLVNLKIDYQYRLLILDRRNSTMDCLNEKGKVLFSFGNSENLNNPIKLLVVEEDLILVLGINKITAFNYEGRFVTDIYKTKNHEFIDFTELSSKNIAILRKDNKIITIKYNILYRNSRNTAVKMKGTRKKNERMNSINNQLTFTQKSTCCSIT